MELNHWTQGSAKHWHFQLGKLQSAVKVNGTLGLLISLGHLHAYSGFLTWHLADGETEAQDGSSTCAKSFSESVTDPEPEGRNLCIPVPLSDHTARCCTGYCREWYITSKRGKDAPSAPVLEGLAASLIHSLQLHCWKRVQKEDQATRKQPQYLIWLDLAGRLLQLYICSFLTKGIGVSFFSSLYLFYGSPVNFPSIIRIGEKLSQMVMLKHFLPVTGHKSHHVTCHWAGFHRHVHIGKKNTRERERDAFSCNYTPLFNALQTAAKSDNLLS